MQSSLFTVDIKMDRLKQFVMFILVTLHLFISPSSCTDKLFVADAYNATILLAETDGLSFVNSSFNRLPFTGLELPAGVEFDPRTEIVYWTDASLHTVNRAALNGSMQQVIAQLDPISIPANFEYPYGIALNLDENKVYWADQYHDVIEMADLDGSNREDLISTGFNTYAAGIVYSTIRKKIFWTEQGPSPKIEMVNPDGTGREVLVDSDLESPHGICLDMAERRLYWTDPTKDRIESIHLDEMTRLSHIEIPDLDLFPFGIAKYFEDFYFSDVNFNGVYAADLPDGVLYLVDRSLPTPVEIHIYADTSCTGFNLCDDTGECILTTRQPKNAYVCICEPGYTGAYCEQEIDECASSPCIYGYCSDTEILSYECTCQAGFTGHNCEIDINDCDPDPCINGVACTDGINSFTCDCVPGYTDSTCSTDINDCDPVPCMNGGNCTDGINSFNCDCVAGYSDSTCSTDIDDCDPDPCMNGGTCTDGINTFNCDCVPGYTDITCSTAIDRCFNDDPCGVNEECTNTDLTEVGYYCNCSEGLEKRNDVCMASRAIGGSVKFTRLNGREVIFTDSLNDPESEAYRNLENLCYKILHDVLMNIVSTQNNEWDVEITGFSSGSVVVDFEVMVFDSDRANLNDQAAAVETSLGLQQPGIWQTSDGSVSLKVESIVAFGAICLTNPCSNGMCVTSPGDIDYKCICDYGYIGQYCITEVICLLPNHPSSQVVMAQSVYRGGDFITIQCDDKTESVVWQCNGTSGNWIQLANLDCRPEPGGLSTGVIIGIVVGIVVVVTLGMIFCFLYKMASRKRPTTNNGMVLREHRIAQPQGRENQGGDFAQSEFAGAVPNRHFDRTGTLPAPPLGGFTPSDRKEGATPEDLPPAYDYDPSQDCSGGKDSNYEEIIHKVERPNRKHGNVYLEMNT